MNPLNLKTIAEDVKEDVNNKSSNYCMLKDISEPETMVKLKDVIKDLLIEDEFEFIHDFILKDDIILRFKNFKVSIKASYDYKLSSIFRDLSGFIVDITVYHNYINSILFTNHLELSFNDIFEKINGNEVVLTEEGNDYISYVLPTDKLITIIGNKITDFIKVSVY